MTERELSVTAFCGWVIYLSRGRVTIVYAAIFHTLLNDVPDKIGQSLNVHHISASNLYDAHCIAMIKRINVTSRGRVLRIAFLRQNASSTPRLYRVLWLFPTLRAVLGGKFGTARRNTW